jgi:solute carrier family 35, member F1/2
MKSTLKAAVLGQLLAIFIAISSSTSTILVTNGYSSPILQTLPVYATLFIVFAIVSLHTTTNSDRPWWRAQQSTTTSWWAFALISFLDVEANYLVVLAFRYTSLTSVTLLDCFSIPASVLFSIILLGSRYRPGHFIGAGICVLGLSFLIITEYTSNSGGGSGTNRNTITSGGEVSPSSSNIIWAPLLGDVCVLLGASLYAICNVLTEKLLGSDVSTNQLLTLQGAFGFIISLVQAGIQYLPHLLLLANTPGDNSGDETSSLSSSSSLGIVLGAWAGFIASMTSFYSLMPLQLTWGGAALLNLSLLTSDVWTGLARFFFFDGFQGHAALYFIISLVAVSAGIGIYTKSGPVCNDGDVHADTLSGSSTLSGTSKYMPVHSNDTYSNGIDVGGEGGKYHSRGLSQDLRQTEVLVTSGGDGGGSGADLQLTHQQQLHSHPYEQTQ